MNTVTKILYFIVAIVLFSSIGVTIPLIIDCMRNDSEVLENLNQNLITYYVAIFVTCCLDIVIKLFNDDKPNAKPIFLALTILNVLVLVGSGFLIGYNENKVSIFVVFGVILSYIIWWIGNYNNPDLNANNATGGSTQKELKNA